MSDREGSGVIGLRVIIWLEINVLSFFSIYIYHHHHVVPPAEISLTLSCHFSQSFFSSGRSSDYNIYIYIYIYIYIEQMCRRLYTTLNYKSFNSYFLRVRKMFVEKLKLQVFFLVRTYNISQSVNILWEKMNIHAWNIAVIVRLNLNGWSLSV